uniref:Uncharacterized protein n=1 Tax=Lepeophtheirus salmonis TaxID=72036 RepID=A0A0K2UAT8_LEPSM
MMRVTLSSLLFTSFILAPRYLRVETGNPVSIVTKIDRSQRCLGLGYCKSKI